MTTLEAVAEKVAVLDAEMRAHTKADETGFQRINSDTSEIKAMVRDLTVEVKSSVERIHARIDDESSKGRHSVNNAAQTARAETKVAMAFAQDAHDEIQKVSHDVNEKISTLANDTTRKILNQKIWFLVGSVVVLLNAIAWGLEFFVGVHK